MNMKFLGKKSKTRTDVPALRKEPRGSSNPSLTKTSLLLPVLKNWGWKKVQRILEKDSEKIRD